MRRWETARWHVQGLARTSGHTKGVPNRGRRTAPKDWPWEGSRLAGPLRPLCQLLSRQAVCAPALPGQLGVSSSAPGQQIITHPEDSKIWGWGVGVRGSHKRNLPPCKMAALKHLSGAGGGPGQKALGCPGSLKPHLTQRSGIWGYRGGEGLGSAIQPALCGSPGPEACPLPSLQAARPQARASSPWPLTPVYKHSLGRGGAAGVGGGRAPRRTPPAERDEELVRESGPAAGKDWTPCFWNCQFPQPLLWGLHAKHLRPFKVGACEAATVWKGAREGAGPRAWAKNDSWAPSSFFWLKEGLPNR